MTDDSLFRPYERLIKIRILGKRFEVLEKNTLLRALQFLSSKAIAYGRFCWNQECHLCRVSYVMPGREAEGPREILSCKVWGAQGMRITKLSEEPQYALRKSLKRE